MRHRVAFMASAACALVAGSLATGAQAQAANDTDARATTEDIIVTARKRQESLLKVPVIVTALSDEKIEAFQTTQMADLPKLVPGLVIGNNILAIGAQVAIRGVGTSSADPGVDQSVSLNIDGLSLGQGLAFSSGMFDLQQIEVLKGPQALFYGKSSPGGVIVLRTADPTDEFEVMARAGYEVEGREGRGELVVSGPLTETLKLRLAGMLARGQGYFRNRAVAVPGTGAVTPTHSRAPRPRNFQLRGTVVYDPAPNFRARLKINVVRDEGTVPEVAQLANCPQGPNFAPAGIPFIGGDDCKMDRNLRIVYMDPANFAGIPHNGVPYLKTRQNYGTLELSYDPTPQLNVTSLTAVYSLSADSLANTHESAAAGPTLAYWNDLKRREFTQEFRLDSDFQSPLNFSLGAFYQDGRLNDRVTNVGNSAYGLGAFRGDGATIVDIETYSLFGQLRWRIAPQLELAGGARWTDETRSEVVPDYLRGINIQPLTDRVHFSNITPEFTVTYTPTDDLTLFGSYKQARKSGSFSVATPIVANGQANDFGDERVQGGEIGIKSRLFDRQLTANLSAYDYRYKGLQVGAVEPSLVGRPIVRTVNAGSARAYGVDLDLAYKPAAIDGLSLNGAVNWNRGRYKVLDNVPCWAGQTIARGCNLVPNPTALDPQTGNPLFTAQDLSGTPLIRAPKWQATFGFDYAFPVFSGWRLTVSNSNQFSSKFATFLARNRPNNDNYQESFLKSDLGLALADDAGRWEFALIGKNITDKVTASNCSSSNLSGGLFLSSQRAGGVSSGPGGLGENLCYSERGRSVWLRLTLRSSTR